MTLLIRCATRSSAVPRVAHHPDLVGRCGRGARGARHDARARDETDGANAQCARARLRPERFAHRGARGLQLIRLGRRPALDAHVQHPYRRIRTLRAGATVQCRESRLAALRPRARTGCVHVQRAHSRRRERWTAAARASVPSADAGLWRRRGCMLSDAAGERALRPGSSAGCN